MVELGELEERPEGQRMPPAALLECKLVEGLVAMERLKGSSGTDLAKEERIPEVVADSTRLEVVELDHKLVEERHIEAPTGKRKDMAVLEVEVVELLREQHC